MLAALAQPRPSPPLLFGTPAQALGCTLIAPPARLPLLQADMAYPGQTSVTLYPLSSYTFGTKPPKFEKDNSVGQRMERLKEM